MSGRYLVDRYDRVLLLYGEKRNAVLDLSEVRRYGSDSHGDESYVSLYGLEPARWYGRGARLLGRTVVECTRDELASAIGADVAERVREMGSARPLVIDPFAGSGNTLYWILRHLPSARGVGCELDPKVYELTAANLRTLGVPVRIEHVDYRAVLRREAASGEGLIVVFIAPPWGKAFDPVAGLDLLGTDPPIDRVVGEVHRAFVRARVLCAIQVPELIQPASLQAVQEKFDRMSTHMYALDPPGQNHGILLGARD